MTQIKDFNRSNWPQFEATMLAAMQRTAADFGVTLEIVKSRVSSTEATLAVRCASALGDELEQKTWNLLAAQFGFKPEDFGRQFAFRSKVYAAVRLDPAKVKYPLIAEDENGRRFKFPEQSPSNPYKWVAR